MNPQTPDALLDETFSDLQQARRLLIAASPRALEECRFLFERVRTNLETLQVSPARKPDLRIALTAVRRELAELDLLLYSASRFYAGWLRLRGYLAGGYDGSGEPATVDGNCRVLVEG